MDHESDPRGAYHHVNQRQIHDESGIMFPHPDEQVQGQGDQDLDGADGLNGPELARAGIPGLAEKQREMPHDGAKRPEGSAHQSQNLQPA
jgi:hypothetical protein